MKARQHRVSDRVKLLPTLKLDIRITKNVDST